MNRDVRKLRWPRSDSTRLPPAMKPLSHHTAPSTQDLSGQSRGPSVPVNLYFTAVLTS